MTDSLRDRIAAVLQRHRPMFNTFDGEPSDWCECGMPITHVADAVIEALAMHREVQWAWNNNQSRETGHRYVTEWTTDD